MGLKFRRGSTAQQSGSLAFGEPYVNTTLGTLVVGGATGDIVLSAGGTGSTGNFGAISGSGLDITGNANIAGNLTLGGAITIGDASADTVNVVASLSSSLIPSVTNAFDLGSETKIWRDLYISTGSIKFVGTGGAIVGTLSNSGNGMSLDGGVITRGDSSFGTSSLAITSVTGSLAVNGRIIATSITGAIAATNGVVSGSSQVIGILDSLNTFSGSQLTQNTALATISGSLISSASANTIAVANLNAATSSYETKGRGIVSGSSQITYASISSIPSDIVSGSSQITLSSTTGFSTYSTSVDSRITTEKGRVDAILSASSADKDSFAEIVTLINSVDTTNDSGFASFYTASVGRLNNLETTSGSVNISVSNLNTYTGSNDTTNGTQNTRLTALEASASTALSTNGTQATSITNLNSATASLMIETANLETFSSSALTRLDNLEGKDISITLTGDVTGTGTITNLANVSFATTIAADSVALGTDTTGNYVASLVAGTNITLSNNSGEGATPTIGLTNNTISGIALGSNLATLTIGTGLSGTSYNGSGAVTIANTGVTTITTNTGLSSNVGATGAVTITNTGVTSNVAGTGITVSGATGAVTITNSGVTSAVAGTGVSVSGATGAVTFSIGQAVATSSNVQFNSLGIGMAASATAGRIDATNDIVAFSSSDIRFKENITPIENALDKISKISGNTYDWKVENKAEHGYEGNDVGVIAQEIEAVLPQLVQTRENGYKAVKYDKLVALLIEGIKEQQIQIEELKAQIGSK